LLSTIATIPVVYAPLFIAIKQYKATRFAIDPITKKPEPLLTFKRGALVHFAVSQYEVYMATRLEGQETFFLPFNKGTEGGGAGNDVPDDVVMSLAL